MPREPSYKDPIMHMVVPGRRALGEDWRKVTIGVKDDKIGVTKNEPTPAPVDNNPIFIPALGNISMEMADYMLEYRRRENEDRATRGLTPRADLTDEDINAMFQDWMEIKLRHFQGKSVSGPGGWTQRERSADRHG
jgi:hypothetical protein